MTATHGTTTYLTCTETAKLLRKALKAAHPGVKFSVRSDSYAGGASIRVEWLDGPSENALDGFLQMYAGATFDGMTDMKNHHSTILADATGDVREVHMGADFVFSHRKVSDQFVARCAAQYIDPRGVITNDTSQCGHCGDWTPAGARWVSNAHAAGSAHDYHCSMVCAARHQARYTSA